MSDPIREAIQQHLDGCGDGWSCGMYAVALSIERINSDGEFESEPWCIPAPSQSEWFTDALLRAAEDARNALDVEDY